MTKTTKPTKEEIKSFNDRYREIIERKRVVERKMNSIVNDAYEIDKLSEELYWEAYGGKDGSQTKGRMFYNDDKDGMLKCVSKAISKKIDELQMLRCFSIDITI